MIQFLIWEMDREGGKNEKIHSLHFLFNSSFSLHFLFIFSFSLHFLAVRLPQFVQPCKKRIPSFAEKYLKA